MTLLFHFQGPELMQADRHPTSEVAYPVVVLLNAVTHLLALPVEVSYTLPEMLEALGSTFAYRRRDYYHFPLGHGLRAEALHAAWYRGKTANFDEIRNQARLYLFAPSALLRGGARTSRDGSCSPGRRVRAAQRCRHPAPAAVAPGLLCPVRESAPLPGHPRGARRSAADAGAARAGDRAEGARRRRRWSVVGPLTVEPEAEGFPAWLLVRDDEEGRRAQVEYSDYWYRNKFHGGPAQRSPGRRRRRHRSDRTSGETTLRLSYAQALQGTPPRRGERFLLYQRFTDFTTDRIVKFLEDEDRVRSQPGAEEGLFLRLLRGPEEAAAPLPVPVPVRTAAVRGADGLGFTPSQRLAFDAICRQRVTAVWGPPGTGKTHFLASAIVAPRRRSRQRRQAISDPGDGVHARRHRKPAAQARRAASGNSEP